MQEPQAQISQNSSAGSTPGTTGNANASQPAGQATTQAAPQAAAGALAGAQAQARPDTAAAGQINARSAQPLLSLNGLDPQTHALVRQQLEVLANQSFAWRGEVWPDAPMNWEISRREAWQELDGTDHPEHWATRLTLNLPQLGEVQARITLAGDQLVMHLVSPQSHGLLSDHTEELRARYRAQGLQLSQLSVAAFDTTGQAQTGSQGQKAETGTSTITESGSQNSHAQAEPLQPTQSAQAAKSLTTDTAMPDSVGAEPPMSDAS
jgi:hypothetical protein